LQVAEKEPKKLNFKNKFISKAVRVKYSIVKDNIKLKPRIYSLFVFKLKNQYKIIKTDDY